MLLLLAFLNAALVEVKLRRALWRWRARTVNAEGGPRGRRKPGIGVGIFRDFFSCPFARVEGLDSLVDFGLEVEP